MEKSFRFSFFVMLLMFLISFGLCIFAVLIVGVFSISLAFYLFLATIVSTLLSITIIGGVFTSLTRYLVHIRQFYKLNSLTHPLLLRLSTEAPGTYHHSILVANLSAKAAKTIGADSLICRVASYFHDIGKLKNPGFFVENQNSSENHEKDEKNQNFQSLKKDSKIVLQHVDEGVKMVKDAHLPREIINIVAQHHGTTTCSYFYELAKKIDPKKTKKAEFKYSGPKPQTKEAAIIMLADSIEAKARVKDNAIDIPKMVKETIDERISENQLDESSLSQKEITRLKNIFTNTLESMLHPRIEYPKK